MFLCACTSMCFVHVYEKLFDICQLVLCILLFFCPIFFLIFFLPFPPFLFSFHRISRKNTHVCSSLSMKNQNCPICLDDTHSSQRRCVILQCGHVGHNDCLQGYWSNDRGNIPKCPTCRKSSLPSATMNVYWNTIRRAIALQPITSDSIPINVGDKVQSPYGQFVVDSIVSAVKITELGEEVLDNDENNIMCHGRLINWKMNNNKIPTATIQLKSLKKDFIVNVSCNDCGKRFPAKFHFLGMECLHCKGYNTARL